MKRAIIIGATSGIGKEVAQRLLSEGWQIGIAGRRQSALEDFRQIAPEQIKIQSLDVTQEDSAGKLDALIHHSCETFDIGTCGIQLDFHLQIHI
ncbi:SDR family NAD(P)-dependent oxidoreductase, partial [Bacteroides thetaiotaomicron]|uniref:SDR family NAD(P)-dependent oxidoreductase n=1 Tax=Bacteroides thetaiotaomicron TaxID=818 RepID=UPI0039B5ECA5